jgi:hypothetical protein
MIQADSIGALYNFEDEIPSALETVLEANITVSGTSIEKLRGSSDLHTPRIDVAIKMGQAGPQMFAYKGGYFRVFYGALLQCTVVTEHEENSNAHGILLGELRAFMQYGANKFNNAGALKYHAIRSIQEAGTLPSVIDKDNVDSTTVAFSANVEILSAAFPP